MFVRLFGIKASESLEKNLAIANVFTKKKNGEKERKRALYNLRMPKLQEIFTTVLQNIFPIILL